MQKMDEVKNSEKVLCKFFLFHRGWRNLIQI